MSTYKVGVGKADITDDTKGLQMQGFADPRQKTKSVLHTIYSRAFVIQENKPGGKKVAISIAEIWSCTKLLKAEVLEILVARHRIKEFTEENLHIAGTHTHSAPGGYTGYKLYNQPLNMNVREDRKQAVKTIGIIASGIAKSIAQANKYLKTGRIYISKAKPIAFTGKERDEIVPSRLPFRAIKIGEFVLLGIPGEVNTMAGRNQSDRGLWLR